MPKLLLVEDDPFIAEIYKKKFETSGFTVVNAVSGRAVLKEVREQSFDLVLLDLVLPEMGGMDVLKELRHGLDYPKDLKVVIFSNLSGSDERALALKLGANGFISKTEYSPSQVVEEVNRFLRQFSEQGKNVRESVPGAKAVISGKRILLIEDEAVFVEMFSKRLSSEGYEVVAKNDGVSGLQAAMEESYDLIITDVMMPGMDGRELITQLRDTEQGKDVPIFILSASILPDDEGVKLLADAGIVSRVFMKTELTPSQLTYAVNDYFRSAEPKA